MARGKKAQTVDEPAQSIEEEAKQTRSTRSRAQAKAAATESIATKSDTAETGKKRGRKADEEKPDIVAPNGDLPVDDPESEPKAKAAKKTKSRAAPKDESSQKDTGNTKKGGKKAKEPNPDAAAALEKIDSEPDVASNGDLPEDNPEPKAKVAKKTKPRAVPKESSQKDSDTVAPNGDLPEDDPESEPKVKAAKKTKSRAAPKDESSQKDTGNTKKGGKKAKEPNPDAAAAFEKIDSEPDVASNGDLPEDDPEPKAKVAKKTKSRAVPKESSQKDTVNKKGGKKIKEPTSDTASPSSSVAQGESESNTKALASSNPETAEAGKKRAKRAKE